MAATSRSARYPEIDPHAGAAQDLRAALQGHAHAIVADQGQPAAGVVADTAQLVEQTGARIVRLVDHEQRPPAAQALDDRPLRLERRAALPVSAHRLEDASEQAGHGDHRAGRRETGDAGVRGAVVRRRPRLAPARGTVDEHDVAARPGMGQRIRDLRRGARRPRGPPARRTPPPRPPGSRRRSARRPRPARSRCRRPAWPPGRRRAPPRCRRPTQPHNARLLGQEVEVAYPFHPLCRRPAVVVADQFHNGSRHLTLRVGDGSSCLVPAWMIDPAAASVKIVDVPRLPVACLLDLRALLDSRLACTPREAFPEGGDDGEAVEMGATGSVRGAAARHEAWSAGTSESHRAASSAPVGGDGGRGRAAGDGR